MRKILVCILIATLAISTSGCNLLGSSGNSSSTTDDSGSGSGSGSGTDAPITGSNTGTFVDNVVAGVSYTASPSGASGVTDSNGYFTYDDGDTVTFTLGEITLGSARGSEFITPISLYPDNEDLALNIAQFLQSIDSDGDASNGITPNEAALEVLKDIDFTSDNFEAELSSKLPAGLTFVTKDTAMTHLETSFLQYGINPTGEHHAVEKVFVGADSEHGLELWKSADGKTFEFLKKLGVEGLTKSSSPSNLVATATKLFFFANSDGHGRELWVTDGTKEGTHMVYELYEGVDGSFPSNMTAYGDKVIFTLQTAETGSEPWISDGTEEGTFMLKDINSGTNGSSSAGFFEFDGIMYFRANHGTNKSELYRTDGTPEGTYELGSFSAGNANASYFPNNFVSANGYLYFILMVDGVYNVARTDGTEGGITFVAGSDINDLAVVGDNVYYITGDYLYRYDGTTATIMNLLNSPSAMYSNGSVLYLVDGSELYLSDGLTTGSLTLITDGSGGTLVPDSFSYDFIGNDLIFTANDSFHGTELFKADASTHQYSLMKDIYPGGYSSSIYNMVKYNDKVYFLARTLDYGYELWVSDGTTGGTKIVKDIYEGSGSSSISNIAVAFDKIVFGASDLSKDKELWSSEGTEATTNVFIDVNTSPEGGMYTSAPVILVGENYVIRPNDNTVWVSDKTNSGTVSTGYNANYLSTSYQIIDGYLYFITLDSDTSTYKIIKTDGTELGTEEIDEFYTMVPSVSSQADGKYIVYGKKTNSDDFSFYVTDGTTGSAKELLTSGGDTITNIYSIVPFGEKAIISAFIAGDSLSTMKGCLYMTDGTQAGTEMIYEATDPNFTYPANLTVSGDLAYFSANTADYGIELWATDGTTSGTQLVKDITEGVESSTLSDFVDVNGTLYFTVKDSAGYENLWKSDGTAEGTVIAKDFSLSRDAANGTSLYPLVKVDKNYYFKVTDHANDSLASLWVLNGSTDRIQKVTLDGISYEDYNIAYQTNSYISKSTGTEYFMMWFQNKTTRYGALQKILGSAGKAIAETDFEIKSSL